MKVIRKEDKTIIFGREKYVTRMERELARPWKKK